MGAGFSVLWRKNSIFPTRFRCFVYLCSFKKRMDKNPFYRLLKTNQIYYKTNCVPTDKTIKLNEHAKQKTENFGAFDGDGCHAVVASNLDSTVR